MQVHIVTQANRAIYLDEIEEMHRQRHRVFVELMGWKALESPDGLDVDEFDNANATYLIAIDRNGVVRGSGRMIPSWKPHLLKNLFPEYASNDPPVGPGLWEWSRHLPGEPGFSKEIMDHTRLALHIAVHEFAASRHIDAYVAIAETKMVPRMVNLGWHVDPLCAPRSYGEGVAVGIHAPVDPLNMHRLRDKAGRSDPVMVEISGVYANHGELTRRSLELAYQLPPTALPQAVRSLETLAHPGQ